VAKSEASARIPELALFAILQSIMFVLLFPSSSAADPLPVARLPEY